MSQTPKTKLDMSKSSHQVIVAGITACVTTDGLTVQETNLLLDDIIQRIAPALMEMHREKKAGDGA